MLSGEESSALRQESIALTSAALRDGPCARSVHYDPLRIRRVQRRGPPIPHRSLSGKTLYQWRIVSSKGPV